MWQSTSATFVGELPIFGNSRSSSGLMMLAECSRQNKQTCHRLRLCIRLDTLDPIEHASQDGRVRHLASQFEGR